MAIQLKIQIRGIKKPPVWRRIEIPGNFSFHDLHNTIQAAFGWWNEHLYQFQRHPFDGGWTVKEPDEENDPWGEEPEDSRETNVLDFIQHMGLEKFVYVYDFGDSWVHDITVENVDQDDELDYPICLAGKGACPPEDCGGPWGYEELKKEMDKDEISEFDQEEVNEELESITASSGHNSHIVDVDDEEDDKPLQPAGGAPDAIQLMDILKHISKAELIDLAEDLGIEVDERANVKEVRKQYAEGLMADPVKMLSQLPMEDLLILDRLRKHPTEGLVVDCYRDYYDMLMVVYHLAEEWYDDDDDYYIQVPEDFWQVAEPHLKGVMDDLSVHRRVTVEGIIIGMTNLYGQVNEAMVAKELVRLHQAQTEEDVLKELAVMKENSLFMKMNIHYTEPYGEEPMPATTLFLSPYGWEVPQELADVIAKHESVAKDYKLFSEFELILAANSPVPLVANPMREPFMEYLTRDLSLNEWQAMEICHDLWYFEMHKEDEGFEDNPGEYFREEVLYDYDASDAVFQKGMRMLDDYLNNLPHWQLKGHTPTEAMVMLNKEQQGSRMLTRSRSSQHPGGSPVSPMNFLGNIGVTMPIIAEKKPGRNDPCPCGSGKKYKNCCGRGN